MPTAARDPRAGLAAGLGAFFLWGLFPLYWKLLAHVDPFVILAHRVVWTVVFVGGLIALQRRWRDLAPGLTPVHLALTVGAGFAIGINWYLFIGTVTRGHVLEASLGYFMNPLMNVLAGIVVFRERLRPRKAWAFALAGAGVVQMAIAGGIAHVPWVSLALAVTFALYAVLRKLSKLDSLAGLFGETAALAPVALVFFATVPRAGLPDGAGWSEWVLLAGGGIVTALPLLLFSKAARELPLSTLGFLQYISPSMTFLLGVLVFGEHLSTSRLVAFACVWAAIVLATTGRPARPEEPAA